MKRLRRMLGAGAFTVALAALAAAAPPPAAAHSYRFAEITIGHLWAPPPAPGDTGIAVYGAIFNRGKSSVTLTKASATIAERVRFRINAGGQTRWPAAIDLKPGKPVSLAPWGLHVWLEGLRKRPGEGDSFDLTLDFGAAGKTTVEVRVEKTPGD